MIITLLPAIAPHIPKQRSPSHIPKTAIALPHPPKSDRTSHIPKQRSHLTSTKQRSHLTSTKSDRTPTHQKAIAPHIPKQRTACSSAGAIALPHLPKKRSHTRKYHHKISN
ncbi:MAG: hypothetical protein ACKPKD_00265 [Microcystis panniformis]